MSTSRTVFASALVLAVSAAFFDACAADAPKFGKPISEADAAAWDISIGPNGVGLPAGSGTPAQGAAVYAQKCASCHGEKGEGGLGPRLFGGIGTLKAPAQPVQTVGSYWPYATMVFDFVRRAMPWDKPKSLTNDEVYASVAYILSLNGIMKDGEVLNKDTIMKVPMPNRDGFVDLYPNKF
jgi:cytochrome c